MKPLGHVILVAAGMLLASGVYGQNTSADDSPRPSRSDAEKKRPATVLRLARSVDGLKFTPTGQVLLQNASSPDLTRLPNGDLIAVFDYKPNSSKNSPAVMCQSRSTDGGRSWSRPAPIRLSGEDGRPVRGRHGDLVPLSDGYYRLYFVTDVVTDTTGDNGASNEQRRVSTVIRSAITRDGDHYKLDDHVSAAFPGAADVHPTVVVFDQRVHLYTALVPLDSASRGNASGDEQGFAVRHFVSRDGRRFDRLVRAVRTHAEFVGAVTRAGKKLRAYVSDDRGIRSLVSQDGKDWPIEPGVRLAGGRDPAVARLKDGSFLMLYAADLDEDARRSTQLALAGRRIRDQRQVSAEQTRDDILGDDAKADVAMPGQLAAGDTSSELGSLAAGGEDSSRVAGGHQPGSIAGAQDDRPGLVPVIHVPVPDFKTHVDYIDWYRSLLGNPVDNAYPFYASFIPNPFDPSNSSPEWPEPMHMFCDPDHQGPPAPWDPQSHPEWEASNEAYATLREQFREATRHEGFALPVQFNGEAPAEVDSGRPILIDLILPHLSHHRRMAKVIMANAWRTDENGRVSSQKMSDAWRTILRGADHLNQGATLIEHLVAIAEQAMVHNNARRALAHHVFADEDELEAALDTLLEHDRGVDDSTHWLQGEYAMEMDVMQYVFSPAAADGTPRVNPERVKEIMSLGTDEQEALDRAVNMGPQDAWDSIDAFTEHYRELSELMPIGYPLVRAADLEAVQEKYVSRTPMTEVLLPSLSRVHTLRARNEAICRATQLSYAVRLFKARNGRWPESLDELPPEHGARMRTDPFTGADFGYLLGDTGPTIYSLSENGIDDGGIHSRRWGDDAAEGDSDDYILWPPQD